MSGGFCPGGSCPGGFCPRGDFVQRDFVQGILSGGFCPGGFCPRTSLFSLSLGFRGRVSSYVAILEKVLLLERILLVFIGKTARHSNGNHSGLSSAPLQVVFSEGTHALEWKLQR